MKLEEITRRGPSWMISVMLSLAKDRLLNAKDAIARDEFSRFHAQTRPYTSCGNARLRSLYDAVRLVVSKNIPGDVVECGTARGGSAALMALTLQSLKANRVLWALDTYEGMPGPTAGDPDLAIAKLYTGTFAGGYDEVRGMLERLKVLELCKTVKGKFQDTLPTAGIGPIAVLHVDCDWYESVLVCLDQLYDRVSPGGVIQFDDYGHWEGARKAVDEFVARRAIRAPLTRLDYAGRRLIKPG